MKIFLDQSQLNTQGWHEAKLTLITYFLLKTNEKLAVNSIRKWNKSNMWFFANKLT